MLTSPEVEKVVQFILLHNGFKGTQDELRFLIDKHNTYDTLAVYWDKEEVAAYARYNIIGNILHVIHTLIRPSDRKKNLFKDMVLRDFHKYPNTRFIRYERELKTRKEIRTFDIFKFLKKERYVP